MNSSEITSFLSKSPMFSRLPEEDLIRLADLTKPRECARGEVLFHQGDFGNSMYFICRGEAEVFFQNQEGAESVVAHLKEGDCFGEMALLTGSPRSASVRAAQDVLLLSLFKNDFDEFLKSHPDLAMLFVKLLAERMQTTNLLYLHELDREEKLKRLLCQEEEKHLTRLVGKTKQFQDVEKQVEGLARSDEPVIIVGPEGTASEDVARLIHLNGRRRDRSFMIVDLAGGDEWRAYRSRTHAFSPDKEADAQLFEEFQISTIFGHERGCIPGAEASRIGGLEISDGGTILLKNIDRLTPGTRERLLFYLLEKKFYPLGSTAGVTVDTRVVGHLSNAGTDGELKKSLRGRIPDILWKNRIDLPPLARRRRDIPVVAEAFLEKYTALTGKGIKTISPPAINILLRYSWPGNDRELERVIERGVLVCEGETLSAEHIFLGLTPYSEKGRPNLLRIGSFKRLFSNLKLRGAIQAAVVMMMIGAIGLAILGAANPGQNLGLGIVWYYWWPLLFLSFLLLGRLYCSICPIYGVTKILRKLGSLDRPAPRLFNYVGVGVAAVLSLGLFWSEHLFQVKEIPTRTPILLGAILSSAIVANFIFRPEVWCRYLCPMGYFSGVFSCLALVELRANNTVCSSQCKSTSCYKGVGKQAGCPMKLLPVSLTSNQFCKMCGTCIHNCAYSSVHLDLRWPGAEIWENKEPSLVTSVSIPALIGILYPLFFYEGPRFSGNSQLPFTLLYLLCAGGAVAAFLAVSMTQRKAHFKEQLSAYGFAYLPLAFAGHLAFLLPFLLAGLKWIMDLSFTGEFHAHMATPWPQRLIVAGGIVWSWWAIRRLSRKRPFIVSLAHGALVLILGWFLISVIGPSVP